MLLSSASFGWSSLQRKRVKWITLNWSRILKSSFVNWWYVQFSWVVVPPPSFYPTKQEASDSGRASPRQDCLSGARVRSNLATSLRVVPSGIVCARWFKDTTRMSMAVVAREAFVRVRRKCLGAVESQSLQRYEGSEVTRGNDVIATCLTPINCFFQKDVKNNHDFYLWFFCFSGF